MREQQSCKEKEHHQNHRIRTVSRTNYRGRGVSFKALLRPVNFTLGPDVSLYTEKHKNSVRINAPNSDSQCIKAKT